MHSILRVLNWLWYDFFYSVSHIYDRRSSAAELQQSPVGTCRAHHFCARQCSTSGLLRGICSYLLKQICLQYRLLLLCWSCRLDSLATCSAFMQIVAQVVYVAPHVVGWLVSLVRLTDYYLFSAPEGIVYLHRQ